MIHIAKTLDGQTYSQLSLSEDRPLNADEIAIDLETTPFPFKLINGVPTECEPPILVYENNSVGNSEIENLIELLSDQCRETIYHGADVTFSDGDKLHYTFEDHDQRNIEMMVTTLSAGVPFVPYKSSDRIYRDFTLDDARVLHGVMFQTISENVAYYTALTEYVRTIKTSEELSRIHYGMELPSEYSTMYEAHKYTI